MTEAVFIEVGGDHVSFLSYVLLRVLLRGNYVYSGINLVVAVPTTLHSV